MCIEMTPHTFSFCLSSFFVELFQVWMGYQKQWLWDNWHKSFRDHNPFLLPNQQQQSTWEIKTHNKQ